MFPNMFPETIYKSIVFAPSVTPLLSARARCIFTVGEPYKSDVRDRDQFERRLRRACNGHFTQELEQLLKLIGDPPLLSNVPSDFWDNGGKQLRSAIEPVLIDLFIEQSETLMGDSQIFIDWTLINRGAADWARLHGGELVRGITDTTRRGVGDAVARYYEDGQTIGQLQDSISRWYNPARSEMIAVTEVTRAASEAEQATARQIMRDNPNIEMVPIWQTNNDENDELVCPICGPKHGQEITDGQYPPAHPRCCCWVTHEMRLRNG